MLATWRVAPALAAGNTVVLKPPEWAPLTASLLADIAHDAGLPDGAFNVRAGDRRGGGRRAHRPSRRRPHRVHRLGRRPASSWRGGRRRTSPRSRLELGGKSPFVIFADADLDAAVAQAVSQFDNAGQVCLAGTRLLVGGVDPRRVPRAVLSSAPPGSCQGDPRDEATDIGPLITREHFERVDGFVQRAQADGARVRSSAAGPNDELGGLYYRPTLFTDAPAGSEILTQEVFGPVLTVQPFADEDEAVALANDTRLRPGRDRVHGRLRRAPNGSATRLVAGTVWVNCFFVRDLRGPVRRLAQLRDRPRGRRVELRFLRGREERRARHRRTDLTEGRDAHGRGRRRGTGRARSHDHAAGGHPARDQRRQGDHAGPRAASTEVRGPRPAEAGHRDRVRHALGVDVRAHRDLGRTPDREVHQP